MIREYLQGGNGPKQARRFPLSLQQMAEGYFEGGMTALNQRVPDMTKGWLPQHPEFCCPLNAMTMEWYNGTDIESPYYESRGVMIG